MFQESLNLRRCLPVLAIVMLCSDVNAARPEFFGLGFAAEGGFASEAKDVSRDGTVVVGQSETPNGFAGYRWTREGGMRMIDGFGEPYTETTAYGVSPDGDWVVGLALPSADDFNAYRWNEATGIEILPDLVGPLDIGYAEAVSDNGQVVVGIGIGLSGYVVPTYWDADGNVNKIGDIDGNSNTGASDVSADGRVIVGTGTLDPSTLRAFRWTNDGGLEYLDDFTGAFATQSIAVSLDGSTIVGIASVNDGVAPFRWTAVGGTTPLSVLSTADETHVSDVSGDGSIAVGSAYSFGGSHTAVIWDRDSDIQDLQILLSTTYGLSESLEGWRLLQAAAISGDGKTIVGNGLNRSGQLEAWAVHLAEPHGIRLAAAAVFAIFAYGLRRT